MRCRVTVPYSSHSRTATRRAGIPVRNKRRYRGKSAVGLADSHVPERDARASWLIAIRALVGHDRDTRTFSAAQNVDFDCATDFFAREMANQIVRTGDGCAIKRQEEIACGDARAIGRAVRLDCGYPYGALLRDLGGMS